MSNAMYNAHRAEGGARGRGRGRGARGLEPPVGSNRAANLARNRKRHAAGKVWLRPHDDQRLEGDAESDFGDEESVDEEMIDKGWTFGGADLLDSGHLPATAPTRRDSDAGSSCSAAAGAMDSVSVAAVMASNTKAKEAQAELDRKARKEERLEDKAERAQERQTELEERRIMREEEREERQQIRAEQKEERANQREARKEELAFMLELVKASSGNK